MQLYLWLSFIFIFWFGSYHYVVPQIILQGAPAAFAKIDEEKLTGAPQGRCEVCKVPSKKNVAKDCVVIDGYPEEPYPFCCPRVICPSDFPPGFPTCARLAAYHSDGSFAAVDCGSPFNLPPDSGCYAVPGDSTKSYPQCCDRVECKEANN